MSGDNHKRQRDGHDEVSECKRVRRLPVVRESQVEMDPPPGLSSDQPFVPSMTSTGEQVLREVSRNRNYFNGFTANPVKALQLWYLNSGATRFHAMAGHDANAQHTSNILAAIEDERLQESERDTLISSYCEKRYAVTKKAPGSNQLSMDLSLMSCGACGIRDYDRCYNEFDIATFPSFMRLSEQQNESFDSIKNLGPVWVPTEHEGVSKDIHLWKAKSVYESILQPGVRYHLHPELISTSPNSESTLLCNICQSSIMPSGKTKKPKAPELSIASGIDFSDFHRLGLCEPNVHEKVIISKLRRYAKVVKISLNGGSKVNFTGNRIKSHVVMFEHDAPFVAGQLLSEETIKNTLKLHLVGPRDKMDKLLRDTLQTDTVFGRPHVVYEWLSSLAHLSSHYSELKESGLPSYTQVQKVLEVGKESIIKDREESCSDVEVRFEESRGSDVAEARQTEIQTGNLNQVHLDSSVHGANDNDVPTAYSLVTRKEADTHEDDMTKVRQVLLTAVSLLPTTDNGVSPESSKRSTFVDTGTPHGVSRRGDDLMSEFDPGDVILPTAFPDVFLLGTSYGIPIAKLSSRHHNHLLRQFTTVPAKHRPLQAYLFDAMRRITNISGMRSKVRGRAGAMKMLGELLESDSFRQELKKALDNPSGKEATTILKKLLPILNFNTGQKLGTPVQTGSCLQRITAMSERYHVGAQTFITISLDDLNNPKALCLTHRTVDATHFPASTRDVDLLSAIENGTIIGQGSVDIDCTRFARAKGAIENPVAYVSEFKSTVRDILTILIGLPPKGLQGVDRVSKYYKHRALCNGKGIFGHTLAYYGTVEDHSKGTLHCHFVLFGGLDPRLLQTYSSHQDICNKIGEVLDSMYQVELPYDKHLPHVVRECLRDAGCSVPGKKLPASLLRNIKAYIANQCEGSEWTRNFIQADLQDQQQQMQWHAHRFTCAKGAQGCEGCRLCKPSNLSNATKPSELLIKDNRTQQDRSMASVTYSICSPPTDAPQDASGAVPRTTHPLDRETRDNRLIIWELKRRRLPSLPAFPNVTGSARRQAQVKFLTEAIQTNDDGPDNGITLFLREITDDSLDKLYNFISLKMEKANGYMVECSPILSFCTGSHNAALLMGSSEQGRSALLYVSNYVSKSKVNLEQCLTLLARALNHCDKYPSRASDSGTSTRTAQYVMTRTLNQLDLLMELSDYQVAASLLHMPVEITSDNFTYCNGQSEMRYSMYDQNYSKTDFARNWQHGTEGQNDMKDASKYESQKEHVHPSETKWNSTESFSIDMFDSFGSAPLYTVGKNKKKPVPYPVHYRLRGEELQHLNRREYAALFRVEKKEPCISKTRQATKKYKFGGGHDLQPTHIQVALQVQPTLIMCQRPPKNPGSRPTDRTSNAYSHWKVKADKFARYYLTMHRPEVGVYHSKHRNSFQYDYNAFESWLGLLVQEADSGALIAWCRLQAILSEMRGLDAEYVRKHIVQRYRCRSRDKWTDDERKQYSEKWRAQRRQQAGDAELLDEFVYSQEHGTLSTASKNSARALLKYSKTQCLMLDYMFAGQVEANSASEDHKQRSVPLFTNLEQIEDVFQRVMGATEGFNDCAVSTPAVSSSYTRGDGTIRARDKLPHSLQGTPEQHTILTYIMDTFLLPVEENAKLEPRLLLVTGQPGTGKSYFISMIKQAVANRWKGGSVVCTSYNGIAAVNIGGTTISSLLQLARKNVDVDRMRMDLNIDDGIRAFIIDEVSTLNPNDFALVSGRLSLATGNPSPFGGLPVILVGDFKQLPPVFSAGTLCDAALNVALRDKRRLDEALAKERTRMRLFGSTNNPEHNSIREKSHLYRFLHPLNPKHSKKARALFGEINKLTDEASEFFSKVIWMELTQQVRSQDAEHDAFLHKMGEGQPIGVEDFNPYKQLNDEDFADSSAGWNNAPVLVATNRERFDLTESQCEKFATTKNKHVYRWPAKHTKWKAKPPPEYQDEAMSDPCFWEYFVEDIPGFVDQNLNREAGIANGTRILLHSLVPSSDTQLKNMKLQAKHTPLGGTITLQCAPAGLVVELIDKRPAPVIEHNRSTSGKIKKSSPWYNLTLDPKKERVLIPIKEAGSKEVEVPVRGGDCFSLSRVSIIQRFPVSPGLASTVHKAQGRTLDKVIVALSRRSGLQTDSRFLEMSYEAIYVAMSRVRRKEDIRLLIHGNGWEYRATALSYVTALKPNPKVRAFFRGFNAIGPPADERVPHCVPRTWNAEQSMAAFGESKPTW